MPVIKPFKAFRPELDLVTKVASLPYDVLNSEEARQLVKDTPYSFLHVNKEEIDLDSSVDHYDQRVYEKASENLNKLIKEKVYLQDEQEKIYIYRQIMKGRDQTGLVICVSIDDYLKGKIKKHENTREDKEKDRINHIDFTDANTGPVFLTYKAKDEIKQIVNRWTKEEEPVYDFTSEDGITHTCWVIDDESTIQQLIESFAKIDYLYIADGHHRAAAATKVGLKRREQIKDYTGKEEFNYFMSVLFPHDELYIMDYNRVAVDLAGNSEEEFIQKISEKFTIEEYKGEGPYRPEARHTFGMYLVNRWYKITAKSGTFEEDDAVDSLDVSILQNNLLTPILEIADPRTDQRIEFVGRISGLEELEKSVNAGKKEAFALYPTPLEELRKVTN